MVAEFLLEWAEHYVKNKDMMLKKIKEIIKKDNKLIVKYTDKEITYIAVEELKDTVFSDKMSVVTVNSEDNIKYLITAFDKLTKFKELVIIFVNPFSNMDAKWLIQPHVHALISEKESLERGIRSIAESVDKIGLEMFKEKLKSERNSS